MDDTDLTYPEIRAGTAAMKCRTRGEPLYNGSLGVRQPFSPHRSHFVSRNQLLHRVVEQLVTFRSHVDSQLLVIRQRHVKLLSGQVTAPAG